MEKMVLNVLIKIIFDVITQNIYNENEENKAMMNNHRQR